MRRLVLAMLAIALTWPLATGAQVPPPKPKPRVAPPAAPKTTGTAAKSAQGRLLVIADATARLWVDGVDAGTLAADQPRSVTTDPGVHIVVVLSATGGVRREVEVTVPPGQQQLVRIDLRDHVEQAADEAHAKSTEYAALKAIEDRARSFASAWVPIRGGNALVGCVAADSTCLEGEPPQHSVPVAAFEMMVTEVTILQFSEYARATMRAFPSQPEWNTRADQPVVNVRWSEAQEFCRHLKGRLPAEAEWEHAARAAGNDSIYPWGNTFLATHANGNGTPIGDRWPGVAPVGSMQPAVNGILDLIGNVWEWAADTMVDGNGAPSAYRVARGGSWQSVPAAMRTSVRARLDPERADETVGFRCIRDRDRGRGPW